MQEEVVELVGGGVLYFLMFPCASRKLALQGTGLVRAQLLHPFAFKQCKQLRLKDRYIQTSAVQSLCICGGPEPEDLCHDLLASPLYSTPRKRFLGTILVNLGSRPMLEEFTALLTDVEPEVYY